MFTELILQIGQLIIQAGRFFKVIAKIPFIKGSKKLKIAILKMWMLYFQAQFRMIMIVFRNWLDSMFPTFEI